jgi:hypothetical protein
MADFITQQTSRDADARDFGFSRHASLYEHVALEGIDLRR